MPRKRFIFFAIAFILSTSAFGGNTTIFYNVNDYGIGNDTALATTAINDLIQAVNLKGGGTLYFPAGEYYTGPIRLLSNITIFIDAGAQINFSDHFDDYLPMVETRFEGVDIKSFSPLFYAYKAQNISIVGRGTINGNGQKWWDFHNELYSKPQGFQSKWQKEFHRQNADMVMPDDPYMFERGFCRPPFIQPMYCENIRIEGITIINSPFWTVNPEFCENVTVTGVTIVNPPSPNTDGINPESCKNVHISNCHISVGDDCITIKSGKDRPGREKGVPAENYTIINCTMLSGHGGVVIGSEMSGNVKNIVISNCIFDGTDRGIRIKSTRGRGGIVEDIRVSNIVLRNIRKEAIKLNLFYSKTDPEPVSDRTPRFRDIHISNMSGDAKQAIALIGLPEMPVQNISFSNINLDSDVGVDITDSENITFNHVTVNNKVGPALILKNSKIIDIDGYKTDTPNEKSPVILVENSSAVFIHDCFQTQEVNSFVHIKGKESTSIDLRNNNLLGAKHGYTRENDVKKTAVSPTDH